MNARQFVEQRLAEVRHVSYLFHVYAGGQTVMVLHVQAVKGNLNKHISNFIPGAKQIHTHTRVGCISIIQSFLFPSLFIALQSCPVAA